MAPLEILFSGILKALARVLPHPLTIQNKSTEDRNVQGLIGQSGQTFRSRRDPARSRSYIRMYLESWPALIFDVAGILKRLS
jgi:hypothetical protein